MKVDLHCHSTASDGRDSPFELYRLACLAGIELLAITDHDTVDGVLELSASSVVTDACALLAGVEFSCLWNKRNIHVVGLAIDPTADVIGDAVQAQKTVRYERARRIGDILARQRIEGAFEGALALANGGVPGRPHFADYLVAQGHCRTMKSAFTQYLSNSRLAGVEQHWPSLSVVVGWIVAAGGVAVLAHPQDYGLTRTKLRELVTAFGEAGGRALELAASGKPQSRVLEIEQLCKDYAMAASVGSDYHGTPGGWRGLGRTPVVPASLTPVWQLF